jgi:hypothetical protein
MAEVQISHTMGAFQSESEAYEDEAFDQNSLTVMANVAGAVISLALIAGIGVWGYKLMIRDVSGIPVVKAIEGDMRVRPDNPGGVLAEHQGLAVNRIAAQGTAAGPVDQVVLAPRAVELAAEDQPIVPAKLAPVVQPAPLGPAEEAFAPPADVVPAVQVEPPAAVKDDSIDQIVAELTAGITPMAVEDTSEETPSQETVVETAPVTEIYDGPGLRLSMRPKLRPAEASSLVVQASYEPPSETAEIEPSAIPAGTRLVQLGAYESTDVARSEWRRLDGRFGDYMQGKSRVIERAQTGGRTFYRLRAMGFVDLADARRFCSAIKAEGADCIPVASK